MTKKCYFTTPIYYVNAKPHIGHAYTSVLVDTFTRYYRFIGREAYFLTGTDEHGTKIEKMAKDQGMEPQAFVDSIVPHFQSLWKLLDIRYDDFIRTTEERHKKVVARILQKLTEQGDIYKATYEGWYCTPCESFWTELQLVEGKCPDCHREVQRLTEDNYFFKLSKHQDWLIQYIQDHPDFIFPEMRRNEILGFLREKLEDLCITRPRTRLTWGIDFPGSPDHVVYVWFDALVNYISAIGYGTEEFDKFWPADIHFMAKDILRQHAVYWPIMLKAMGLEMPRMVLAHGWWKMSGAKVSKSLGNIVDPILLSQKYGVDALRYFMLKEVTLGADSAFSEELLRERYITDLANDLGNLWFRFASMLDKYFQGVLPDIQISESSSPLIQAVYDLYVQVQSAMDHQEPREALLKIFSVVVKANQFVEENKPWSLAKDPARKGDLGLVMTVLAETLAHVAVMLLPFLPNTAHKICERLGLDSAVSISQADDFRRSFLKPGQTIVRGDVLFPKLEEEEADKPAS